MIRFKTPAMLLGATALTVPLALMPAHAQQQNQQETGTEGACEQLYQLVEQSAQAGEDLLEEFQRAPQVAEANEADACVLMIEKVETAGGMTAQAQDRGDGAKVSTDTETFRATDTVQQTVTIEKQAVVEGEVLVRQPIPEIEIEEGRAEVQVRERPANISVDEQPAQIIVRQKQANVRVSMPKPTITVEQPAPEIIITMPAPGINVDQEQPEVNVVMAKPTVTVAQADPEVEVDVDARLMSADEATTSDGSAKVATRTERTNASGQPVDQGTDADVVVRQQKPSVRFMAAEAESNVRFNRANPEVVYEASEPNIEVTYAEEPTVEVRQVGEPTVRLRRQGDQDQQAAAQGQGQGQDQGQTQDHQQQAATQDQQQQDQQQAATADQQQGQQGEGAFREDVQAIEGQAPAAGDVARMTPEDTSRMLGVEEGATAVGSGEMLQITAADLDGRDVVTLRGEEVGEIEGIFQNGGRLYAIISHGGFLGIGENEIALPMERIALRGDEVLLLGLTEEELEEMPDYDYNTDQEVVGTDVLEIGRYE